MIPPFHRTLRICLLACLAVPECDSDDKAAQPSGPSEETKKLCRDLEKAHNEHNADMIARFNAIEPGEGDDFKFEYDKCLTRAPALEKKNPDGFKQLESCLGPPYSGDDCLTRSGYYDAG